MRIWHIILISLGFGILFFLFLQFTGIPHLNKPQVVSDNISQLNITLSHIDKDGTIWVEINGNLYYLYLSDNGTQKQLIFK